jgi:hypothetical protein
MVTHNFHKHPNQYKPEPVQLEHRLSFSLKILWKRLIKINGSSGFVVHKFNPPSRL